VKLSLLGVFAFAAPQDQRHTVNTHRTIEIEATFFVMAIASRIVLWNSNGFRAKRAATFRIDTA